MAIPDYESLMLPLLRYIAEGERPVQSAITALASQFKLSPEERQALLPSGRTPVFNSRVHWAGTYLVQSGLLSRPRRGVLQITERGKSVLAENPQAIDNQLLSRFAEFNDFRERSRSGADQKVRPEPLPLADILQETPKQAPEERIMPAPSVVRQHAAAADPLPIARWLILRKIEAARATLTEICPTAVAATSVIERSLIELRDEPPQTLATLRGIEGRCGAAYFGALRTRPLRWAGIKRRPIPDDWHAVGLRPALPGGGNRKARLPVQAMLNLGYAVLEARVKIAATAAGFALDHAFLHGPQGSRMAPRSPLALDLQEPLRGVVDRAVLRFATSRTFRPGDFVIMTDGVCRLHPQLARVVVGVVDHELGSIASPASAPRRVVRELVALIGTR